MTKLCPPEPRSPLLLYVSASNSAVSAVLVQEKQEEGKLKQIPVYFASEAMFGSKIFYSELEKIAYAVIMVARKLRHYVKAHRIRVITNQPLSDLFANREASTRHVNFDIFVRLIRTAGLRDTKVILVRAPRGAYVQFEEVFYMPRGYVVRGTSLGREREQVSGLECGGELVMLLIECVFLSISLCFCLMMFDLSPLRSIPTSSFIVQGESVYRG
jgi:hypothetical protein